MYRLTSLMAVIALTAAAAVNAQPPGPFGGPRFDMDDLAVLLDLDTYQKGEVARILKEQREAMRATRERVMDSDERPSREQIEAMREQNRAALISKLQAVLTEPQITKFKVLAERPRGRRGPGDGEGHPEAQ
jgi:hypothetical protein